MSHQIKRRDLLLGATALTAVSLTSISLSNSARAEAESAPPRPHIVYIVADDLGRRISRLRYQDPEYR